MGTRQSIEASAAYWGERAQLALINFFHALEDGDAKAAAWYEDKVGRFATYAGTCARLAREATS
jgi:hypothetical protein